MALRGPWFRFSPWGWTQPPTLGLALGCVLGSACSSAPNPCVSAVQSQPSVPKTAPAASGSPGRLERYVPHLTIQSLGPPYDGRIVAFPGQKRGCWFCDGASSESEAANVAVEPRCRCELDHQGTVVGTTNSEVVLLDSEANELVFQPFAGDCGSLDGKAPRSPSRRLALPRSVESGLEQASVGEVAVALLYAEPREVFHISWTRGSSWEILPRPLRAATRLPRGVWVQGVWSAVDYSVPGGQINPAPSLLRVYRGTEPVLDVYGDYGFCGSPLNEHGLDLLARTEAGPTLRRLALSPVKLSEERTDVPLDDAWCVASVGERVVVSGSRGQAASVALYSHGRWAVRDIEPIPMPEGIVVALGVAFDGRRVLLGSPDSARAREGQAFLLRVSEQGELSEPLTLRAPRPSGGRTIAFGRTLSLPRAGPALVGWGGEPRSWATHYRSYLEPCR